MQRGNDRGNLFARIPSALPEERIEELFLTGDLRIERILSSGHTSPAEGWYDQDQDEWVALLQGEARLQFEGSAEVKLAAGDWLLIRAHQRHRVSYTSTEPPCLWLAVHVPAESRVG